MRLAAILIVLMMSRVAVLAGHELTWTWWSPVAYLWQDGAVALAFAAVDRSLRRTPRLAWMVYAAFVAYIAVSVPVTRVMSTPMTWPMWRAAGGALNDSMWYYVTPPNLLCLCTLLAAGAVAPWWLRRAPVRVIVAGCLALVLLGPAATRRVDTRGLERNAWSALAVSALPRVMAGRPERSRGACPEPCRGDAAPADWRGAHTDRTPIDDLTRLRGAAAGRHVVLVSLESTAAQYLGLYGADPDVMPNLSELARSGIVFENAYAVYPESIKGLFSILCSIYPAFDLPVDRYAGAPCVSVAARLAARHYRTALFHSGRFAYLGMDAVIRNRGYEVLADAGDIGGHHESSFGVDDRSTVARMLDWIDGVPNGERFFVTYLPIAGHHPYGVPERGPYPDQDEAGRYRNALRYSDAVLGTLITGIRARGLERQTLWIVLGDHGEAFGQHDGNFGHTFQLYEENVHVPLVIAAPGMIAQPVRSRRIVSLIDTTPTILDLLGAPVDPADQGRSMLDGERRMALFFADYSLGLLGLRDGRLKYVYEMESGRSRLFDLERDPHETHNIADRHEEEAAWYARDLRRWSAAQKRQLSATSADVQRR